jgi:NAD-dependent deacetylase
MDAGLKAELRAFSKSDGQITVLTGAGISAESGIPTFRGPEGYWTIGSKQYHPQEMATYQMFVQHPEAVWQWYLYRMGVCRDADPNPGHFAVAEMEDRFQDRFTLITQNVDGLHLRAGNSLERTFQIHGNVFFIRCAKGCIEKIVPIPEALPAKTREDALTETDRQLLVCPDCGGWLRPHVLWFDETYNEEHYRFVSSLKAARRTELLLVVGTSGATNLPNQVAWEVKDRGGIIVDINIEENPFTQLALSSPRGYFIKAPSAAALPEIMSIFLS